MKPIWSVLWLPFSALLPAQPATPGTQVLALATSGAFWANLLIRDNAGNLIQVFGR